MAVHVESSALTRFANNAIHQNVAEQNLGISVRAVVDGRTARASTNKSDDDALRRVAALALSLARNEPRNPDLLSMPRAQKYQKVSRFSPFTAEASPMDRAERVKPICRMAEKAKQTAAGIFANGGFYSLLANSAGLYATYSQSRAEFSVTILEEDSSGWAKASSMDMLTIDSLALAESASRKAAESRRPKDSRSRPLHRYFRAVGRARSRRFSLLRFFCDCGARQAVVPHRSHGEETFRREHHPLG